MNLRKSVQKPAATEQAHPADRFAREILAILERDTARLRRLMRHALDGNYQGQKTQEQIFWCLILQLNKLTLRICL